jgi:hypothetical protein
MSLQPLAARFVKAGVSIGGLSDAHRGVVLGRVGCGQEICRKTRLPLIFTG